MVKRESGLEKMFREQAEYDAMTERVRQFKTDVEHTRHLKQLPTVEWVEQAGKMVLRLKRED